MPSIFLFTPPQATACTQLTIGYCHFTILNRQCVYLEILLYIFIFNLYFHHKFGLKFNLEVVLKSLKFKLFIPVSTLVRLNLI